MGWSVSGPERERRQAQVLASAKRRTLAQDNAGPVRGFGRQEEGQLFQGTVSAPQEPPWPLQCSRPSTTCSRTAPSFRILAPIISIDALPRPRPDIWSPNSPNSDTRSSFSPWPRQPDARRETQLACADRPGHTPQIGSFSLALPLLSASAGPTPRLSV